jgi:glutamate/aspartate transport system substrate-binding protein
VIYSQPYFNAGQVLVVRADDETFSDPRFDSDRSADIPDRSDVIGMPSLAGRTVAVEWGSLADMETRRLKETADGLQTLPQPTAQDALSALVAGQADAAIADAVSVFQFIGGEGGEQVRIVETLTDEPYVIASRAKSRRLGEVIDEALADLSKSGALDELRSRWF